MNKAVALATEGMALLKQAVLQYLGDYPDGLSNAEIGRALGIYRGHKGHEGHISRTVLALLEQEGRVAQDPGTKHWTVVNAK